MLKTRVMPCLLLKDGGLVKTIRFKEPGYVGDPVNAIRIYNEKEVDELIFLDISATPEKREPPLQVIAEIASECFMPVTYGGGIRRLEDMTEIYRLGIEKIAINSFAAEHPEFIQAAADRFGSQSVVVSIDVKKTFWGKYEVRTHGGRKRTGRDPVEYALEMERRGAGEILLTSIDRDGTMAGYDVELIRQVSSAVTIPVIACGGSGSVQNFGHAVREGGAAAVAAGSMVVYHGRNRAVLINFPTRAEIEAVLD